jgi:CBS domain-containing protein
MNNEPTSKPGDSSELAIVADFLRECLPFNDLPDDYFEIVLRQLEITYYRSGQEFYPNADNSGLRIVRSGAVELRNAEGVLLDRLGEGKSFNLDGLNKEHAAVHAVLIEDCLLYLLPQENYLAMRQRYRHIDRFFHDQRNRRLHRAPRNASDANLMMHPVKTLMSTHLLTAGQSDPIVSVATAMHHRNVSACLILDDDQLCGIVTDRDLRSRVISAQLATDRPVSDIMTRNPHAIDAMSTIFDATLFMTRHGCHHLPVIENAKLVGMLTTSDLMLTRQDDPVYMVRQITRQDSVEQIQETISSLPRLLVQWAKAGVHPNQIGHILTVISDAVTVRLIELHLRAAGPAPVPFCWLGFGSQARGEQLIGADQDNGLLIADDLEEAQADWFKSLAKDVCDGLNTCGYVYCPGDIMATTDEWRQTLSGWKKAVNRWTSTPTPGAVMRVSIFFDLRAVYGDNHLCQQLQQHMLQKASSNSIFLAALAANALRSPAPLGVFRRFLVERNGEHRDSVDLKKRGVIPIVDIVRIHALANQIDKVNTRERLAALAKNKAMTLNLSRDLEDALDFIMQLRVDTQAMHIARGEDTSNHCRPHDLPKLAREQLRGAFTIVHDAQAAARLKFRAGMG